MCSRFTCLETQCEKPHIDAKNLTWEACEGSILVISATQGSILSSRSVSEAVSNMRTANTSGEGKERVSNRPLFNATKKLNRHLR